ncbi:hypothetical protein QTQ03_26835 [Micromonospora sp. WMMA1363]|uniref:hypothetical protein n=1 Tax=Micromonospora sp. WMMA1363 TaxID=3053985 RepID=UPI00259C7370|nr:hypothetical protein [Micromonospora sp. WMMA1363]MDM4723041.1 hypothetical protein [Micromonospora sp. WMMA1363]
MIEVGVIAGGIRPRRESDVVTRRAPDIAAHRDNATAGLVDLREHDLPHLGSPLPPSMAPSTQPKVRATEHPRLVLARVAVADVRSQVVLSPHTDFVSFRDVRPAGQQEQTVSAVLDQVVAGGGAPHGLRRP